MEALNQNETELFLEAIYRQYGYDFSNYARASLNRRIKEVQRICQVKEISEMIPLVFHDKNFIEQVLRIFSITVTEMFRDPEVFLAIRENVLPYLKTYPYIKVWHAGCATGQEVYSTAILLAEEEMFDKSTIYATDFNQQALTAAKQGIYNLKEIKKYTENYQKAGGKKSFSEYYHSKYEAVIMNQALKQQLVFAHHNLTADSVFTETHMILCRNVMIYFNKELQERVLQLFTDSLQINGFLIIGNRESLEFSSVAQHYKIVDKKNKIYQKIR
ncbi:MAG: protein-glutamate O-methyltransferase CheR [Candidatus Cloacimonadales bacterium]